jgi:biotin transport system substrate-specific component
MAAEALAVLGGALLIALSARARMPLPFSPVPVTLQTLAVLWVGAQLGARRGALATLVYLGGGALGLPCFAGGGLLGPTGGYLLGFVAAAHLVGTLFERGWGRRPTTALAALLLGNGVIYAVGLPWLTAFVGARPALALGLLPFVPGDVAKALCALGMLQLKLDADGTDPTDENLRNTSRLARSK